MGRRPEIELFAASDRLFPSGERNGGGPVAFLGAMRRRSSDTAAQARGVPSGCVAVLLGGSGVVALLVVGFFAWLRYANTLPPLPPPPPQTLPSPNARDSYLAAAALLQKLTPRIGVTTTGGAAPGSVDPSRPVAELRQTVPRIQPALHKMREGFRHEYGERRAYSYTTIFPQFAQYRSLALACAVAAIVAADRGDYAEAAERATDAIHLGKDVAHDAGLIGDLVGIACAAIGFSQLDPVLTDLDEDAARHARARLAAIRADWPRVTETLEHERLLALHGLAEIVRPSGGRATLNATLGVKANPGEPEEYIAEWRWQLTNKRAMLAALDRHYQAVLRESVKPWPLQRKIPPPGVSITGDFPLAIEFDGYMQKRAQIEAMLTLEETLLAVRIHRLRTGRWPRALREVSRDLLPSVPLDPFTAKPLVYRLQNGQPLLYSVGADKTDNGGKPTTSWANNAAGQDMVAGKLYRPRRGALTPPPAS